MKLMSAFVILLLIVSCKSEGVEQQVLPENEQHVKVDSLEVNMAVKEEKKLANGIIISWLEKGNGAKVKDGDVIMIDYKVRLEDSTIIDGNHLLNLEAMPFMVGFQMQTLGWDMALRELNVGDFARIKLPSELARGKKGIDGLIPENADNFITIRVLSKKKPTRTRDGNKVWVFEENKLNKKKFTEDNKIIFHAMASSPSSPLYYNSYRTNVPFELKLEDNGVIPGLKKALINAKKGDRMLVFVPSEEAYGSKGYLDIVKPNESLFYNVLVMDVVD